MSSENQQTLAVGQRATVRALESVVGAVAPVDLSCVGVHRKTVGRPRVRQAGGDRSIAIGDKEIREPVGRTCRSAVGAEEFELVLLDDIGVEQRFEHGTAEDHELAGAGGDDLCDPLHVPLERVWPVDEVRG
jgi:hypothetical protein